MTTLETTATSVASFEFGADTGEAEAAAAGFLARYSGRTLEAYRHDLRTFFQWAGDRNLVVLAATRSHIEVYRMGLEDRGLAPATVDRRLTTVCGFYRFAHVDGRIRSNPAQHVRRPRVHPSDARGMDRAELGRFLFTAETVTPARAALAVLLGLNGLRVSEACSADIEDLGFGRQLAQQRQQLQRVQNMAGPRVVWIHNAGEVGGLVGFHQQREVLAQLVQLARFKGNASIGGSGQERFGGFHAWSPGSSNIASP